MHAYSTGQWVLLFFFYCLCGWVWESCYVSARQRQWVNRGFLHGPLLPIYGSGAILILLVTLPVEDNLYLVWLFGMIAATALEYVTGAVMENLFKVRYWDYSYQKLNLNGYICLSSSIAWGFFSILLVRYIHPPIGRLLTRVPDFLVDPLALVLTIACTVDAVKSFQAAMDLRETLTRLAEENEELRRLAKRVEVTAAFAEEDLHRFRERTEVEKLVLQLRLESELQEQREARIERKQRRQEVLETNLRRRTNAKLEVLHTISNTLETCRDHLADEPDLTGAALDDRRTEINELIEKVQNRERVIRARSAKTYQRSLRILRANPTAVARKELREAMEALRSLSGKEKQ
jgi:uncharacterized membrane protein